MKHLFAVTSWVLIIIGFTNCAVQNKDLDKAIQIELIESHSNGGYKTEQYHTITNPIELKLLYTQLNLSRKPGLPIPNVNFENESIVAFFMGQKMSGGFSIKIDTIKRINKTKVEIRLIETEPKDMASMAITSPYAVYKVSVPNIQVSIQK